VEKCCGLFVESGWPCGDWLEKGGWGVVCCVGCVLRLRSACGRAVKLFCEMYELVFLLFYTVAWEQVPVRDFSGWVFPGVVRWSPWAIDCHVPSCLRVFWSFWPRCCNGRLCR
jgi:hypothetical protein